MMKGEKYVFLYFYLQVISNQVAKFLQLTTCVETMTHAMTKSYMFTNQLGLSPEQVLCLEGDTAENVWTEIDLVALLNAKDLCHTTVLLSNARQMRRRVAVVFIH